MFTDFHYSDSQGATDGVRRLTLLFLGAVLFTAAGVPQSVAADKPVKPPQIHSVSPSQADPGAKLTVKIKGSYFVKGALVAFSNPAVLVTQTDVKNDGELTAQIEVPASASTGSSGIFVVNPDQSEAEGAFQIGSVAQANVKTKAATSGDRAHAVPSGGQRYDVLSLSNIASLFQNPQQTRGVLSLASGKLTYEESGKQVFSVPLQQVREVASNVLLGLSTGTFHVTLSDGKQYNFMAASLNAKETQTIIQTLQQALKTP